MTLRECHLFVPHIQEKRTIWLMKPTIESHATSIFGYSLSVTFCQIKRQYRVICLKMMC